MNREDRAERARTKLISGVTILLFLIIVVLFERANSIKFPESYVLIVMILVIGPLSLVIAWVFNTKLPKRINYSPWLLGLLIAELLLLIILIYYFESAKNLK